MGAKHKRYKRRITLEIWLKRCGKMMKAGLPYVRRAWHEPDRYSCKVSGREHCGHGTPVRCCACGCFEDPLLEAMDRAATDK